VWNGFIRLRSGLVARSCDVVMDLQVLLQAGIFVCVMSVVGSVMNGMLRVM
jgi:hypothetical protein